jgi:hypothetical protein
MPKSNPPSGQNASPPPEEGELQDKGARRGSEDQDRDRATYLYILSSLTDLCGGDKPNESYVAKQWGLEDNRIFVRRVLRSVLKDSYPEEKNTTVPGLTLGRLAKILISLEAYWIEQQHASPHKSEAQNSRARKITRVEKLQALRLFCQLSCDERLELKLPVHPEEALLQKLVEDMTDPIQGLPKQDTAHLYRAFLRYPRTKTQPTSQLEPFVADRHAQTREAIRDMVRSLVEAQLAGLDSRSRETKINSLFDKVQREISRIEFQAGQQQVKSLLRQDGADSPEANHLSAEFVARLTRSVVENEILTDEFPIHLKHFEIEKVRPLPLYVKSEERESGLLNPFLLGEDEDKESILGLETQVAYKVRVYFYIKLPDTYSPKFRDTTLDTSTTPNRLQFYEEVRGIGSPTSHITTAINRILLWGIRCLDDYFPVFKQVFLNDELMGGSHNSPIWSHSVVKLCKKRWVEEAIAESKDYDQIDPSLELAHGDFCGFDIVEVAVKSALNARLRAIQQTGVSPQRYLEELCDRVEEKKALEKAREHLYFYPFSLRAMEGYLNETIFSQGQYRTRDEKFNFQERADSQPWSLVAYHAHLLLTEAYLREGLYRCARKHLDILEPHIQNYKKTISRLIEAKYHICLFQYRLLADLDDAEEYNYSDRYEAIQEATKSLEDAEDQLKEYLKSCQIVDELPQSNVYPFFYLYSRIQANRARLYVSFPTYADKVGKQWEMLIEPVRLLEKARIYSARDGNPDDYAYQSALQSWCYVMVAYLSDSSRSGAAPVGFSKHDCLAWARQLLNHALLCYTSTGRTSYHQLKNNAGKLANPADLGANLGADNPKSYDSYGKTKVQIAPFIQELPPNSQPDEQIYQQQTQNQGEDFPDILKLDLSILKNVDLANEDQSRYIFGIYSSILLFPMGILKLCDEDSDINLSERVRQAFRMFTYCWAISKDGVKVSPLKDEIILDRIFDAAHHEKFGDSLVQGLYPHRITRMTDLGRIFMAACKLLLVLEDEIAFTNPRSKPSSEKKDANRPSEPSPHWQDIHFLIEDFHDRREMSWIAQTLGQERYNGHLARHYEKIKQYFEQFEQKLRAKRIRFSSYADARNKVVRDMFRLIRGESDVSP